ncbi:hypothetical protein [Psychrobacter sp. ASPA161_6]|uniref:hypothetical protein n=1 Tax=Psychrobacter sp. ASPA161_6 TaxID=3160962 RepID=UPI003F7DC7BB
MNNQVKVGQRWLATDGALNCIIHVVYIDSDSIRLACYDHLAESVSWGITNDTLSGKNEITETIKDLMDTHLLMYDGESPDDTRNRVYDNESELNCPHCQADLDTKYWHTEWARLCEKFVVNCDECDEEIIALAFESKTQVKYALTHWEIKPT